MSEYRKFCLLSETEARAKIAALPAGPEPKIKWAGFDLPGEMADGNLLVAGAIGTGKTLMHRELMRSVIPSICPGSDRRALIYDVKCDLLSELYSINPTSEVLVFNPIDKRSVAWDLAADVTTPVQAHNFADSLIVQEKNGNDNFFTAAARSIVAGVINSLNHTHPENWDLRRLILLTTNRPRLERVLAGSDLIDEYFGPEETFTNVQNTIASRMVEFKAIAALWKHAGRKISLKEWVTAEGSILVFAGNADLQASLQRINCFAFKMVSTAFLSEAESPRRSRLWFFCDDLRGAGRLDLLSALLNCRRTGVRCVLGFQDIEGLIQSYGNRQAVEEILQHCASVSWLRLTSAVTAEWASRLSGAALLPSEFLNLPPFASGNVHGVHLIKGLGGAFKASSHQECQKSNILDFDPRPESEQFLEPWGRDDDEWLDAGK